MKSLVALLHWVIAHPLAALTVIFVALTSGLCAAAPKNVELAEPGRVRGELIANGKSVALKHVYALRRAKVAGDEKRIGTHTQKYQSDGELGIVVITNGKLNVAELALIVADQFLDSEKKQGLILTFDVADLHSFKTTFLHPFGNATLYGSSSQGGGGLVLQSDGLRGEVVFENRGTMGVYQYRIEFETQWLSPQLVGKTTTKKLSRARQHCEQQLIGVWHIERWVSVNGDANIGVLMVEDRLGPGQFRGTLHMIVGLARRKIDEPVEIQCDDQFVHVTGNHPSDNAWPPDQLTLLMRRNQLTGQGSNATGSKSQIRLRKLK
jgi:hypothetical protein